MDKGGIQVIARAAHILRSLEGEPAGLSIGELSARVDLPRSTVQRICSALIDEQMLISAGNRAGVMLGPALVRLAAETNLEIDKLVRPTMQKLARVCGETVNLSMLQGRAAQFIDQVLGSGPLVANSVAGETHPLHSTAKGKALLACVERDRWRKLLTEPLERFTAATLCDVAALAAEIDHADPPGLVYDREEHGEGMCAIGTGFVDPLNRVFALSVPMSATRFAAKQDLTGAALLAARDDIFKLIPGCRAHVAG